MTAARRAALAACVLLPLLAGGCKEAKDIGEELGWTEQKEAPRPPPPPPSLDDRWVPADGAVAGLNQAQWSARWWQWTQQFADVPPYRDQDGSLCAQHQDATSAVWFLAGTDGKFDAVRSCRIPADKHLFVPLMTLNVHGGEFGEEMGCDEKQSHARNFADHVESGLALLDGRPIGQWQRMRAASGGCFELDDEGLTGASDGYWLMLKPLPPGKHVLAITAVYREGPRQSMQNFRYELDVDAPAVAAAQGEPAQGVSADASGASR